MFSVFVCVFLCSFSTLILLVGSFDLKTVSQITYTVLVETLNRDQCSLTALPDTFRKPPEITGLKLVQK